MRVLKEKLMMNSVKTSLSKIYNKFSSLIAFWNYICCKIKLLKAFENSFKNVTDRKKCNSIYSVYKICGVAASI